MSHSRSLSKLAGAGLIVGASCFLQGGDSSVFQKNHHHLDVDASTQKRAFPNIHSWNGLPSAEIRRGQNRVTQQTVHAITTAEPSDATRRMAASYSLLWSPGFVKNLGLSTSVVAALHVSGVAGRTGVFLSRYWHSSLSGSFQKVLAASLPNVVLPLLSSSCCLLQLIINALVGAGGCAGFNTVLGPLRPIFLSLLAYFNWVAPPPVGTGLLRLSLALLPEIVDVWNQWLTRSLKKSQMISSVASIQAVIEVEIPTMGCVACINKIDSVLRQSDPDRIVHAASWLDPAKEKGGRARVRCTVDNPDELNDVKALILENIEGAGFSDPVVISDCILDEQT